MPIIATKPFQTAEYILQLARSISNDASTSAGIAGDILADAQPYVFPILSKCYRDLQDELISAGVETFSKFGEIYGVTPTMVKNPRTLVSISFLGYWNGVSTNPAVKLPPDMIKPLELWECPTGNFSWLPMKQVPDSISSRSVQSRHGVWDFEQDVLLMPGSSITNDLRMKYLCTAPDLTGPNSVVYVRNCQTALANMFIAAVSKFLGGIEMVPIWEADAKKAINAIVNRTGRKEAYSSFQRLPFRGGGRRAGGYGR